MAVVAAFAVPHPPLIVPEVSPGKEREIPDTVAAYQEVARRIAALRPDAVVVSSPHAPLYADYIQISVGPSAQGDFSQFGARTPRYRVRYDETLAHEIERQGVATGVATGTLGRQDPSLDHGTLIPVHFIERACAEAGTTSPEYVRLGLSGLSPLEHYRMGMAVARAAEELGRSVVYVASGDLSHKLLESGPYGFAPEAPLFEKQVVDALATGDFLGLLAIDQDLAERAAECGLRSFQMMAGALDRTAVDAELLSHEGPFGVGYAVAAYSPTGHDPSRDFGEQYRELMMRRSHERRSAEDPLVALARASIEAWVRDRHTLTGDEVDDLLDERRTPHPVRALLDVPRACFVSLKKHGQLRGCIGTLAPTQACLSDEIVANAKSASTRDPRFRPVQPDELDDLVLDVDVLGDPEPVASLDELDPRVYGVIVSTEDGRRGVLLPDLAGVDAAEEQVAIAAQKGAIDAHAEPILLQRFRVERHL